MTDSRGERWRGMRPSGPGPKSPISDETLALIGLTSRPEWAVFVAYMNRRVEDVAVEAVNPNVSALLRVEGRRSLYREINDLASKVSDDRTGRQSGSSDGQ